MMKRPLLCVITCILSFVASSAYAQVTFTDVTKGAGLLLKRVIVRSTAWGDYDGDGDPDVVLMNGETRLCRNEGDGTFLDVTQDVGIPDTYRSSAAGTFADFDNDGDLDLLISSDHGDSLYQNDGSGDFLDVSQAAGILPWTRTKQGTYWLYASVFFDYDTDGLLDIYVVNFGDPDLLYHNEGNGHFQEIAEQVGVDKPESIEYSMGVILGDYDDDVDLDLFIPVDNGQVKSVFYRNDGNGVFVDVVQQAGVLHTANHNGFFWDYDNDGDLDLFIQGHTIIGGGPPISNFLYRNNRDGTFTDIAPEAGIESFELSSVGSSFGDYDNDGWLDLVIAYENLPTLLYHNNGDGTFTDMGGAAGLGGANTGAANFVDYDTDGNLDIFIGGGDTGRPIGGVAFASNHTLYRSNGSTNYWLQLRLIGRQSNRDGIGARVKMTAGELTMMREIAGGSGRSIFQQERLPLHFGLGSNAQADVVEVRWPNGIIQTFTDIPSNQRLTIDELEGILVVVRDIFPPIGDPEGGTMVRIQGEHFLPGSRVFFAGVEASSMIVASTSSITASTPPGQRGYVDVEVVHPDGKRGILTNGFRYSELRISKVTPASGSVDGDIGIQIEGFGFQNGAQVIIGGKPLSNIAWTPRLISGTLPPGEPGSADVSVSNPDGGWDVLQRGFTYIPPPAIEEVSPVFAPLKGGQDIQFEGSGFQESATVQIGGVTVKELEVLSSNELTVRTPPMSSIGPQDIVVINPDGQRDIFSDGITILAPIEIRSVEPNNGGLDGGTRITITGEPTVEVVPADPRVDTREYPSRFVKGAEVFVGDEKAGNVRIQSDNRITATTPSNTVGQKRVIVINPDGSVDYLSNLFFTYNELPQITKVSPDNGRLSGGTPITIKGSNFLPGAKVSFSTGAQSYKAVLETQVISTAEITAITPSGKPGPKDVRVTNPDRQDAIWKGGFTYNPLPTIISISPNYGSSAGGTKITIEGTGFVLGANVMIGARPATTQVKGDTTIQAVTPSNPPGVWDVRVVNPDTQEVVKSKGFISVGEMAYNYPNPFRASQGTTFRYVTDDPVQSITVKIFNLAGIPIDVIQQMDSSEVKWQNTEVHVGLYVYLMEVEPEDGNIKQFRGMLEVYK